MPKKTEIEFVSVAKEEYEEMVRTNQENSAMINQLVEKLDIVQNAQLAGAGVDPKISARALLPRKTVQFLKHYSRSAIPSLIQKNAIVIESYAVSCGDIVHIRDDEYKRINGEFPDMMESNPNKFQDKLRARPKQIMDDKTGRLKIEMVPDPQTVEVLMELAFEVG